MKIIIKKDYDSLGKEAAKIIKEAIRQKPNLVLGLASGNTPLGLYQELIKAHKKNEIDFSKIIVFNLDEYLGLSGNYSQSYNYLLRKIFLNQINAERRNFHLLNGGVKNVEKYCQIYEEEIKKAGGIDLQILGIGSNGHIGFNEPGTSFDSKTHLTELAESTIKDNARFFGQEKDVPKRALTMGLQTIFKAEKILLLASGPNKADIAAKAIEGPVTSEIPASILQKHPNAIFILDKSAAKKLTPIP